MRDRIESRDLETVSRFRYKVEAKAARKKKIRRWLAAAGLAVCLAVLALSLKLYFPSGAIENRIYRSTPRAITPFSTDDTRPRISGKQVPSLPPPAGKEAENIQKQAVAPAAAENAPAPGHHLNEIQTAALEKPDIKMPAVPAKAPAETDVDSSAEKNLRVAGIVSCRGVKNRAAVDPQNTFSIEKNSRLWVWMDVRSKKLPRTLRHVYHINGRRYCEVPLKIKYPRMRTWSNISLSPADVGKWRVDVITETGTLVSRVEFDVIP